MNCVKGTCPHQNEDPKITIQILDQDQGASWGFYCNYDCAAKDVGATLMHLVGGGDMDSAPDPSPEVTADPNNFASQIDPLAPLLTEGFTLPDTAAAGWHPHQKFINDISVEFAKQMNDKISAHGSAGNIPNKGKYQALKLQSGFSVTISGDNVMIDVGQEDFNVELTPGAFSFEDAVPQLVQHVQAALQQGKVKANTPQF